MRIRLRVVDEVEELESGETTMVECPYLGTIYQIEPATTLIWQIELSDGTACVAQGREEVRMAAALGCETYAEYLEL